MTEDEARAKVVAEARSWLGTRYHHRAKLKGIGVDCAQLVLGVYENVGLVAPFDTGDYPMDWALHRDDERYLGIISRLAGPIEPEAAKPGDVVLFKFGRAFSHGAIITERPQIVHANRSDGAVVYGDLIADTALASREQVFFSYWARVDVR